MYSKKRKLDNPFSSKTVSVYKGSGQNRKKSSSKTSKKSYTVSPYAFFTGYKELKAFDFWDNNTGNTPIKGTAGVAYVEFGDGVDSISPGGYSCINRIQAGTGNSQRIGNKIVMKRIDCSFSCYSSDEVTVANANNFTYRYVLIYDKNCGGVAATAAELFAKEGMTAGTTSDTKDFPTVYNLGSRFLFLKDAYFVADKNKLVKHFRFSVDCSLPVTYTGTQAVMSVTNIGQGAVYMLIMACTGANPTKGYVIGYVRTRVYYEDK